MTGGVQPINGADGLRRSNDELDRQIRDLVAQISDDQLGSDPENGEWTLAENLAHIGEFPRYFAREIREMVRSDADVEVGRTHEHPERNEAIAAAAGKDRKQLAEAVTAALDEMADVLRQVSDEDMQRVFTNRKYGREPLTAYLQRYVLGHKAAHVDQLRRTLAAVSR